MAITTTEVSNVSQLAQLIDAVLTTPYKWLSLQSNVLDGSYHPISSTGAYQIGWWGTSLSNSLGVLASAPSVTIDMVVPFHAITVVGDPLLNEYPVDFTVKLYKNSVLLTTITVTGNTQVTRKEYLTQVYDVDKITLTVTKINKPYTNVKIVQSLNLFELHRTDILKPKNTETDALTNKMYRTDVLLPKNTETDTTGMALYSTDILKPKNVQTDSLTGKLYRADSILAKTAETDALTVKFTRTDTLLPKSLTSKFFVQYAILRFDTLKPKHAETDSLQNSLLRTDDIKTKLNYNYKADANILKYDAWVVGSSGSQPGFGQNGETACNSIISDIGPLGNPTKIWRTLNNDVTSDADGGWNTSNFNIDRTKLYRFSVWIKRKVLGDGYVYFGCQGGGATAGVINNITGVADTNPYFIAGTWSFPIDTWVLVVGHVYPDTTGNTGKHANSGVYTKDSGRIANTSVDYRWNPTTLTSYHRSYLYYSINPVTDQEWCYPRVDLCDGTEPSIDTLLRVESGTEGAVIENNLLRVDSLTPKSIETDALTINFTRADNLLPKSLPSKFFVQYAMLRFDTLKPKHTQTDSLTNKLYSIDVALPKAIPATLSVKNMFMRPDNLTPKNVPSKFFTTYAIRRYDSLLPKNTQTDTLKNTFVRTDILKPKSTETDVLTNKLTRVDALTMFVDETPYNWFYLNHNVLDGTYRLLDTLGLFPNKCLIQVEFTRPDNVSPKSTYLVHPIDNAFMRSDALSPSVAETETIKNTFARTDILKPKFVDVSVVKNAVYSTDIVKPKTTETDSLSNSFTRVDTLTPKSTETDTIKNSFARADVLLAKNTETDTIKNSFARSDVLLTTNSNIDSLTVSFTRTDVLKPKSLTTKFFVQYAILRFDSLLANNSTVETLNNSFARTDELKPNTTETDNISARFTKVDILSPKTAHTDSLSNSFTRADSLTPKNTETNTLKNSFIRTDIILTKDAATDTVKNSFAKADSILVNSVSTTSSVTVKITKADDLRVVNLPTKFFTQYAIMRYDTLKPNTSEADSIGVSFTKADVLTPKVVPTDNLKVQLLRPDSLTPKSTETDVLNVSFTRADALLPKNTTLESVKNTFLRTDILKPKLVDTSLVKNLISRVDNLLLNLSEAPYNYKWFYLNDNTLDGSYHPIDSVAEFVTKALIKVSFTRLDNIQVHLDEYQNLQNTFASSDIIKHNVSEVVTLTNKLASLDLIKTNLTDDSLPVKNMITSVDVLKPKSTETDSLKNTFLRQEALQVAMSEIKLLQNTFKRYDVMANTISELKNVVNKMYKAEVLLLNTSWITPPISNSFIRTDDLKPKVIETKQVGNSFSRPDNLLAVISELLAIKNQLNSSDIIKPKNTKSSLVINNITRADNLKVRNVPTKFFTQYAITRYDSLLAKAVETKSIKNSFVRQDILTPKIQKWSLAGAGVYSNDTIKLKVLEGGGKIMASFTGMDNIKVRINEAKNMTNIHTRMDESSRKVYGKVEITYSDPFVDSTIDVVASESGRYTDVKSITDNVEEAAFEWLTLHSGKLDGSFHPMPTPDNTEYDVGWWGNTLSNNFGILPVAPTLTVSFASRPIYFFKVVGDALADNYPVDFTIMVKGLAGQVIHTEVVTDNNLAIWHKYLDAPLLNTTSISLLITKIRKVNQTARILEFFTSVIETYYDDDLVSLSVLEELDYVENSIELGSVSSNEISVELDNSTHKFNVNNMQSTVHSLLKRNRKVKAWLGAEIIAGEIEWYPLGVFYTTQWNVPDRSMTALLVARDILDVLSYSEFATSLLYTDCSLGYLFELVLADGGIKSTEYYVDDALYNIIIPYAWFDKMSHRDALQRLAACALVQLYCDRQGKIMITNMEATPDVFHTFDDDTNIISKDYPFAWNQVTNHVEVQASNYIVDTEQEVLQATESIVLAPSETIVLTYSFNVLPVLSAQTPIITASPNGISLIDTDIFAWGTILTLKNNTAVSQTLEGISIMGTPLKLVGTAMLTAVDTMSKKEDGTQKITISSELIQNRVYAQSLADSLLLAYKEARHDVAMECRGNIGLQLGQKIAVNDTYDNAIPYVVKRQHINWDGALDATVEGKRIN